LTGFWVDGEKQSKEPLGLKGRRLDVETHIVAFPKHTIDALISALVSQGVNISGIVANAIAGTDAVKAVTKEQDCLVLDMGAGLTDMALYTEGKVRISASIPLGGEYITSDIIQGLDVSKAHAEDVKQYYSKLDPNLKGQGIQLDISEHGETNKQVAYDFLSTVVESRVEEIISLIHGYIEPALSRYRITKVFLTGGSAMLPSFCQYAQQVFNLPVAVVRPPDLPVQYQHPAYTACWGILQYVAETPVEVVADGGWRKFLRKLKVFR
jgi:cell division protein FtsA